MSRITISLLTLCLVLAFGTEVLSDSITVRIVNKKGEPIPDAIIKVVGSSNSKYQANKKGEVAIPFKSNEKLRVHVFSPEEEPTKYRARALNIPEPGILVELSLKLEDFASSTPPSRQPKRGAFEPVYCHDTIKPCFQPMEECGYGFPCCCEPSYCCCYSSVCCCCYCCCVELPCVRYVEQCSFNRASAGSAMLKVSVPEDAVVSINGRPTNSKGVRRVYISRNLKEGYKYRYAVRVRIMQNGKPIEQTKEIVLRSTDYKKMTFDFSEREEK